MAKYLIRMLAQPSSYAGLAAISTAVGMSAPLYDHVAIAATGVFGLVAFLMDSRKVK